jgi:hypothetical protein
MKIKTWKNIRIHGSIDVLMYVLNLIHEMIKINVIRGSRSSSFGFGRLEKILEEPFRAIGRGLLHHEGLVRECLGERRRWLRTNPNINLSCSTPNNIGRK